MHQPTAALQPVEEGNQPCWLFSELRSRTDEWATVGEPPPGLVPGGTRATDHQGTILTIRLLLLSEM